MNIFKSDFKEIEDLYICTSQTQIEIAALKDKLVKSQKFREANLVREIELKLNELVDIIDGNK